MLESFLGMLRKRRHTGVSADEIDTTTRRPRKVFWDTLFVSKNGNCSETGGVTQHAEADRSKLDCDTQESSLAAARHGQLSSVQDSSASLPTKSGWHVKPQADQLHREIQATEQPRYFVTQLEDMDIDATVPPPKEYSDCPTGQSETSMNFDYLHGLSAGNLEASGSTSANTRPTSVQRYFHGLPSSGAEGAAGEVDDSKVIDRFVTVLDQLDARVEKFRRDALGLQDKKDFLLMSVDIIKSHDLLQNMTDTDRDEISCYIHRVNSRLSTVELNVRTVRDENQEDALSQINALIDLMITLGDPVISRQRCQQYLNACCSSLEAGGIHACYDQPTEYTVEMDIGPVDKKFESVLLGCTLDDQKNIKKRLQALMNYLNKQTIRQQQF